MIRLRCSTCQKVLGVKPELAGRMVLCPACKTKLRVPAGQAIQPEVVEPDVVEDLEVVKPSPITSAKPQPAPSRRERDDDDRDDEDEEYERRPRRRKRRKRRRSSAGGLSVLDDHFLIIVAAVGIAALLALGLAIAVPVTRPLVDMGLSGLGAVGGIWLLVLAFMEDTTQGVLCLCVPCYMLYFAASRFDEVKLPACLYGIGLITHLILLGMMIAGQRH
ncbi:MAG: hypothetical protein ACJ8F7_01905 [Gemmataceae bacterium]